MKCAFFFGAGASASVDMPTTAEMKQFLRDDVRFRVLERHIIFKDIEDVYTRIEELSNHLIQLYMVEHDDRWSAELNHGEELKLDSEIRTLRDPVIEWQDKFKKKIQNYLTKHLDPKAHTVKFYKDLLEKLHKADADLKIITTNYDLLLDKALGGDLNDGFVSEYGSTTKVWKNRWENYPSKPTLVQLHGAINWRNDWPKNRKNRGIKKLPTVSQEPMMLPLTLKDKDYSPDPYKGMFAKFEQIIADVDLCVVIGYTFRDRKILDVILERLQSNLHVLLLDPHAKAVADKFENTAELVIGEDGSVGCDAGSDSRVYWCDIKFEWDTIGDISRIMGRVSELVGTGSADA